MNDSFSRFIALLAVWILALVPLLLLDGEGARLAGALVAANIPMDFGRP